MTTAFAIRTLIEFAAILLLIYGFIHEDSVIAFEQSVKRVAVGNIRRYIRIRNHKKAVERGEHLHLHSSRNTVEDTTITVA